MKDEPEDPSFKKRERERSVRRSGEEAVTLDFGHAAQ